MEVMHQIDELSGDPSTGYYAEGHSRKLYEVEGNSWFCFEVMDFGEMTMKLHDDLGFTPEQVDMALQETQDRLNAVNEPTHDHDRCIVNFGIASLREGCNWEGHAAAISEAGYCSVCQH